MDNRILVTYATRAGFTAEVAAAIAETLATAATPWMSDRSKKNHSSTATRPSCWAAPSAWAVGCPRRWTSSRPTRPRQRATYRSSPCTCSTRATTKPAGTPPTHTSPLLNGAETAYFEGKMDFSRLSFLDRTVAKMVKSVEADHRDWDEIRQWANAVEV